MTDGFMNMSLTSLWDDLAAQDRPIFLYGTGNGGDKIIAALETYGVKLTGIFASDGFVRDREFHGMKVRAYSDVREEYGDDITVLLAFGTTLPDVREFIELLDSRHDLRIPDVPLYGGDLFDRSYVDAHLADLIRCRELLADEESRLIYDDCIAFRLTGRLKYLSRTQSFADSVTSLFGGKRYGTILDGGAFKGDSTSDLAALMPEKIIAVEADPKTYLKLCTYGESESRCMVEPVNGALWNESGILEYTSSGSRGSGESGRNRRAKITSVPAVTIDELCRDIPAGLIKLDIEGAEWEALDGGRRTILRDQPDMAVSLYHRTDDFWKLTLALRELLPGHEVYLRRPECVPFWDLCAFLVKRG